MFIENIYPWKNATLAGVVPKVLQFFYKHLTPLVSKDKKTILFLIILIFSLPALAQNNPYKVAKISGNIVFDGIPNEPAWQNIDALPLTMLTPVSGAEPTEETILKIAYNSEYFYVSGFLNNKNPDDIRPIGKKRDYATSSTDYFGIVLDTYNDRENGVSFWTNPNGIRTDGTVKNDAVAMTDINFSWNTFWDVKTNINKNGWTAEFRIPFSSLRFQTFEGKTVMGIILNRFMAAKSEMSNFPALSPDFLIPFWKPSLSALIEFEGLNPKKTTYITPYITGGIGQENELNSNETAWDMNTTPKFDAGLDVKYSFTNNLTADLTINTDFAQVEADDQKINLTRYSLYFPEKRVFFLEKSDVFDFSFLGGNNLFYSRRIGLYDGNTVRIYGGARLTGRVGKWDIGILNMQTAKFEENPSENFGVARVKRSVFNQHSYTGGMITSRLGTDGSYNVAYGIDGLFRVTGDEYLTLKWGQTFEKDSLNKALDMAPSRFLFEWQRRKETGFAYDFVYTWSGKSFNPGIGFEVKDDYHGGRIVLQRGWLPDSASLLRFHKFSLSGWDFWNTVTKEHETSIAMLTWDFEAKKGFGGNISANLYREDLAEELTLGNDQAFVPEGRYTFAFLSAQYNSSRANTLSAFLLTEAGNFYDGYKISFFAWPKAIIGTDFDIGLTYRIDHVNFPDRSMKFTNHIVGLKGLMTLTTKTSFSAFIQYNTAINKIIGNIRFRYNPREGNDFYIVYNECLNTNREREIPTLPFSTGRTLLLKYTYTFRL
ncbi:MAG: DUF5916 domain-containing protein [Bacteroidota bacterium]